MMTFDQKLVACLELDESTWRYKLAQRILRRELQRAAANQYPQTREAAGVEVLMGECERLHDYLETLKKEAMK